MRRSKLGNRSPLVQHPAHGICKTLRAHRYARHLLRRQSRTVEKAAGRLRRSHPRPWRRHGERRSRPCANPAATSRRCGFMGNCDGSFFVLVTKLHLVTRLSPKLRFDGVETGWRKITSHLPAKQFLVTGERFPRYHAPASSVRHQECWRAAGALSPCCYLTVTRMVTTISAVVA